MELAPLLAGVLAVWRVTHLLHAEDGPWDMSVGLRRAAGDGFFARLLDCFYCLSLWVALPIALLIGSGPAPTLVLWLGLSGGAIALNRALPAEASYREDP
jgi:hypothetical protein